MAEQIKAVSTGTERGLLFMCVNNTCIRQSVSYQWSIIYVYNSSTSSSRRYVPQQLQQLLSVPPAVTALMICYKINYFLSFCNVPCKYQLLIKNLPDRSGLVVVVIIETAIETEFAMKLQLNWIEPISSFSLASKSVQFRRI